MTKATYKLHSKHQTPWPKSDNSSLIFRTKEKIMSAFTTSTWHRT